MWWRFILLLLLSGCVSAPGGSEVLQISQKSNYRQLSECLFKKLAAEGRGVEFAIFSCMGSAVLSRDDQNLVKVTSTPDGSLVNASSDAASMDRIAQYLEACERGLTR
ncbi:MAG: hypothetical protein H7839_13270 [Magnetococcus sp. YQC-5]